MEALVEFSDVRVLETGGDALWGFSLDGPRVGPDAAPEGPIRAHAFDLRGWVLGRRARVEAVEVLYAGACLWRVPTDVRRRDVAESFPDAEGAEHSGFFVPVNSLSLPPEFELLVVAALSDGTRVELAEIRGSRQALRFDLEPRLRPLMVTTIGRTGSSMLVHLLGAHPAVVAYRPFRTEPRVASYWIGVLRALSEPASYRRQILQAQNLHDPTWWLGREGRLPRRTLDREFQDWLGSDAVESLAELCRSRIDAVYSRIADLFDRPDATYFTEKFQPDAVPDLVWELYPNAREIVLVRDFRDMLCSMLAFNAKRGIQGFGRQRADSDSEFVEEIGKPAKALARSWERRSGQAHLVRYEELVADPARTLEAILRYADLDSGPEAVAAMRQSLEDAEDDAVVHRTAEDGPEASVGRWRRELPDELREHAGRSFAPALEAFGYPVDAATPKSL